MSDDEDSYKTLVSSLRTSVSARYKALFKQRRREEEGVDAEAEAEDMDEGDAQIDPEETTRDGAEDEGEDEGDYDEGEGEGEGDEGEGERPADGAAGKLDGLGNEDDDDDEEEEEEEEEEDDDAGDSDDDEDDASEQALAFHTHFESDRAPDSKFLTGKVAGKCKVTKYPEGIPSMHETVLSDRTTPLPEPISRLLEVGVNPRVHAKWRILHKLPALEDDTDGQTNKRKAVAPAGKKRRKKVGGVVVETDTGDVRDDILNPLQKALLPMFASYRDVWYANRTMHNGPALTQLYALHILTHSLKTRDRVIKNQAKLARRKRRVENGEVFKDELTVADQGFVRPRVLVLLPFRSCAWNLMQTLLALLPESKKLQILKKKRFKEEFGPDGSTNDKRRPADFLQMFEGNSDETFRVGVSFTRKSVKLYSDFYQSDIILASPLGLRLAVGAPGDKGRDLDFLASIEVLVMDQADVFSMQNWDHIRTIMDVMNGKPYEAHDCDFSRIKGYVLNGWSKFFRQTIIISKHISPDINALFNTHCLNYEGRLKIRSSAKGDLRRVVHTLRQVFQRVAVSSLRTAHEDRFAHFVDEVFPKIREAEEGHVLIFIPSYFDFVRVRNLFKQKRIASCNACEYTAPQEVSRSRSNFFHGRAKVMLTTERFHFYHRYKLRGVRQAIMYGLPENSDFYSEFLNMMEPGTENSCLVLFTKYDALTLTRVVGTARAAKLLASDNPVHMFT